MEMTQLPMNTDQLRWPGKIPLTSLYTVGTGGQVFFRALKTRGKMIANPCGPCEQVYLPPRPFCARCFCELTAQVQRKPTGRLVSYTISYVDHDGARLRRPTALGLVQLEGATTLILHYLLSVDDPTEVKIGCRVETVIKPKAKRIGSILDIEGFRVIGGDRKG